MSLKKIKIFQRRNREEENYDLENFFKHIGVSSLYTWNYLSDTGYSEIRLNNLNDKVAKNESDLFIFMELIDHEDPEIGERFIPVSFDLGNFTFLVKSVRFNDGVFFVKCKMIGSDIGENTDGDGEFSIKELRDMMNAQKKYSKNVKARKTAPSDYR